MTYRLDTNAFSDLMREHPAVDARLAGMGEADTVILCPVVRGGILYGLGRLAPGQRRQELETKAVALFARIPGEPMRESAGDHDANVKLARQKQGLAWDENGLWIAATALAVGATLDSRDTDFRPIAGLNAADWTA